MRLFGSRFCSFARILALPRQLFSYVARLNRLFSSGGAHIGLKPLKLGASESCELLNSFWMPPYGSQDAPGVKGIHM